MNFLIECRTIERYWTCLCCGGRFYPQMVQMVWDFKQQRWVGMACLPHSREAIEFAAKEKV